MKFLNEKKTLRRKLVYYFLVFLLFQPGLSIAQEGLLMEGIENEIIQESLCVKFTSNIESEEICIDSNTNPDRIAACYLYTVSDVAEALCLKNSILSAEAIPRCFIIGGGLAEQICLLRGLESTSNIMAMGEGFQFQENVSTNLEENKIAPGHFSGAF